MFFKKKKTVEEQYKNELMRSRMSPISVRTDEIIQQYFFAAKDASLTFEEYLRIRELATKELGLIDPKAESTERMGACKEENSAHKELKVTAEKNETNDGMNAPHSWAGAVLHHNIKNKADEVKHEEQPVQKKEEHKAEVVKEKKNEFTNADFLAMMQSVED